MDGLPVKNGGDFCGSRGHWTWSRYFLASEAHQMPGNPGSGGDSETEAALRQIFQRAHAAGLKAKPQRWRRIRCG